MKKKISRTLHKMIEKNKREILLNQITMNDIEKKIDSKIIANGK
ncbi:FbpB family small basic protein [Peribacillus kribbensis]|nr:FbpB family small basic protein [Peribacillus kribbensis]